MCDCIELGDYVCRPKENLQDKCIEVGNYICCPREKHCGRPCENYKYCSKYNQRNSCHNGGAAKSCSCPRSQSVEPQPRFVEEKFSNRIVPSFLCKNTDLPKPKVRKAKACKKVKQKTNECCCFPTRGANNGQLVSPLMPGIYFSEGVSLAPEAPQQNAEVAEQPEQQARNSNPDVGPTTNPTDYLPGQGVTENTIPGMVPGYMPGSAVYPESPNMQGYVPTIPGYQYPVIGPFGPTLVLPPQIPQQAINDNQCGYEQFPPMLGGEPASSNLRGYGERTSGQQNQYKAAGLPSCRQPPFDPCTGEECNPESCLTRRTKSNPPAPRSRNGLGIGFGPQRQYYPHHLDGTQQEEEQQVTKDCCQRNLDPSPMFNCCCQCSLSSDLIERICKSLQISSCIQNCCCGNCPKMNGGKKSTGDVPLVKRKGKPSKSINSQMGLNYDNKNSEEVKVANNKLSAGPTPWAGSSTNNNANTKNKSGHEFRTEPDTLSKASPSVNPTKTSLLSGCKEPCLPPETRTCSCFANLLNRADDSTQTLSSEKNDFVKQKDPDAVSEQPTFCGIGSTYNGCGANNSGASCCNAGCNSCRSNSYWPYYYYYNPCTGMYYCYRNCCRGCCNSHCNSCNPCCSTSCCQSNVKACCKVGGSKKKEKNSTNPSSTNGKRKETKSSPARKSNPQRNMGGDAMVPFSPDRQDLYEQWVNFQQQYPQASTFNPVPAIIPGATTNPNGYYPPPISTPFYFASTYHNQINMNRANPCSPLMQFPNMPNQEAQPNQNGMGINWTPQ